jgi:ELWxxDGT repeat protein
MFRQTLLFSGLNTNDVRGLWVTDGTAAGTHELTDISGANQVGPGGLGPAEFTVLNGKALFNGVDTSQLLGLWVTDGTTAGTHELTGISGAATTGGGFDPTNLADGNVQAISFAVLKGKALFNGIDTSGFGGLWVSDGTAPGTHELTGISGASMTNAGLNPHDLTTFNNVVLFGGVDTSLHDSLWVSDGTAAGTSELTGISGIYTGGAGWSPTGFTLFNNNQVLFAGEDASLRDGLWVTDGTAGGTHELTGISGAFTGAGGLQPFDITAFNGGALFNGLDTNQVAGIFVTDGATGHELTGISGASFASFAPTNFTVFNNKVLFSGEDTSDHFSLWITDGTTAGTSEIGGIGNAGISGADPNGLFENLASNKIYMTVFDCEVFFTAENANSKFGLWVSDGTVAGTHELTGISGINGNGLFPQAEMAAAIVPLPPPDNFTSTFTSDVLFRNDSTGDTWFETISNGNFNSWHQLGGSDTRYAVVGLGDFFGTGIAEDILFRNASSGDTWFEAMSNGVFTGWHQVGGSDTTYAVVGVGDYFGSGTSDILYRNNSTGDTWFAAMSNGLFNGWNHIGGSDTNYTVKT